eukprot:12730309-Alexandrium_andersonii.AAC.1
MSHVHERLAKLKANDLLKGNSRLYVSPEDWHLVMTDFGIAQQELICGLALKTSFLGKLPWALAGLAHHNPDTVRAAARK